ncbi:MAG: UDP-N-acetylglucosamine 2-epimerase (non-hydrolyzing) [Cyclobacteriaceae bacterium]|nr:UDP-N-acetylglucosamine 2-epimerase (non-hydrolyzing) [Cyclobacteriaceae bacterium]
MIKIITVIGARPQIIKASAISRAIRNSFASEIQEIIVHTGQHYDETMSKVFFEELNVPKEDFNLQVGSGSHAVQTAHMMIKLEEIFLTEKPHAILLYGDTNSTLAAAVAAAKLHIPIIHVEGGVRSFNKKFPEEINRLICDHLSTLIFVPTLSGIENMRNEGFKIDRKSQLTSDTPGVYHCGDIMYDNSLFFGEAAERKIHWLNNLNVKANEFALLTMHRPSNVDDSRVLEELLKAFVRISDEQNLPFVFPVHPRTLKIIESKISLQTRTALSKSKIRVIPPVSFVEMTLLEKKANIIFTDSGGVQKEAYYFKKPCVILLEETPWQELVESGSALLVGTSPEKIMNAYSYLSGKKDLQFPPLFGDGKASEFICDRILEIVRV